MQRNWHITRSQGKEKIACVARNHSVSDLLDLQVPVSLSGSSTPCLRNTLTTQKYNSAFVCSTTETQYINCAVTIRKLVMAQCQSCTTSSISIACKESTSIECKHIVCGAPLCSSFENKGKEICLLPEIK